jgi:5-methylcytosine-specific restriction endonuclease McrA
VHVNQRCKRFPVKSEKDNRIAFLEQQLTAKDEQLKDQQEEIKMFEQLLKDRFIELKEEVKQIRKRRQAPSRIHRTEPQRRQIAKRQNWLCAGQQCLRSQNNQELEEYDNDHIIPLHLGGSEGPDNLQALCPGCHRKKTDRERLMIINNVT